MVSLPDKKDRKRIIQSIKDAKPFEIEKVDGGVAITPPDQKTIDDLKKEDHIMLVVIDGDDIEVKKAKKEADDLALTYEDKQCAITSKPLVTDGLQWYFTRPGFLGTMAINKDTLLQGDLYNPSAGTYKRKLDAERFSEEDLKRAGYVEDDWRLDDSEDHYVINEDAVGHVESLHGSKATLNEMNKAKRLRKLLQPSSKDMKTILTYVGLGAGIGYGGAQYMAGG